MPWRDLVWNRLSIPKMRFICWLAASQGLKTKDKLHRIGVVDDDLCPLCGLGAETHAHLFFECPFSQMCVARIKEWTGIGLKPIGRMNFRKNGISQIKHRCILHLYTIFGNVGMRQFGIIMCDPLGLWLN